MKNDINGKSFVLSLGSSNEGEISSVNIDLGDDIYDELSDCSNHDDECRLIITAHAIKKAITIELIKELTKDTDTFVG